MAADSSERIRKIIGVDMFSPWMLTGPYTVFDVETTGMSPVHNRIIEIGAVRIEHDGSITRYETLIHPECSIPNQITRLTGISNEMVANAPTFAEMAEEFLQFINGSRLVAHNARFDLAFLMESLGRPELHLIVERVQASGRRRSRR